MAESLVYTQMNTGRKALVKDLADEWMVIRYNKDNEPYDTQCFYSFHGADTFLKRLYYVAS